MKAYVATTGVLFGLLTLAHVWRFLVEGSRLAKDPWFVSFTVAAHKRMSVSSYLEETLLHAFEEVGGVRAAAGPHTKRTLRHIRDLRKKHGIDYDSHGGYRFVERHGR